MKLGILLSGALLLWSPQAGAFDFPDLEPEIAENAVLESGENGGIDWTHGYIYAVGEGIPMQGIAHKGQARLTAQRASKLDATRNLLEMVKGVQIDSETTVENFMLKSDVIKTQVSGVIKGFQIVQNPKTQEDYTYLSDGTVRCTIRVPLNGYGGLAEVLLPSEEADEAEDKKKKKKKKKRKADNIETTGLIINAKGLRVKPSLRPRILDENGNEIYGSSSVDRNYALRYGIVGYLKSVDAAEGHERVAAKALVVDGLRPEGPARTDVVLAEDEADEVGDLAKQSKLLDQCKVMFVID